MEFPIKVKVHPNKKKTEIIAIKEAVYLVNVKARAENNQANLELIKFFSKLAGRKVRIIKGLKSRNKIVG